METDATGGMCAPIKNLNCDKRIDNYAIVKSVGIPGDVSSKTVMSFGDMITNDHSSYNIGIFYREFKHKFEEEFKYWPPFDGKSKFKAGFLIFCFFFLLSLFKRFW